MFFFAQRIFFESRFSSLSKKFCFHRPLLVNQGLLLSSKALCLNQSFLVDQHVLLIIYLLQITVSVWIKRHFFFFSQSICVNQRLLFESRLFSLSMRHAWRIGNWQPTLATNWSACLSAREAKVCLRKSVSGGQFVFGGKFVCGKSVTLQHKFIIEMVFGCAGKKSYTQCRHNATFTWTDAKAFLLFATRKKHESLRDLTLNSFFKHSPSKTRYPAKFPQGYVDGDKIVICFSASVCVKIRKPQNPMNIEKTIHLSRITSGWCFSSSQGLTTQFLSSKYSSAP